MQSSNSSNIYLWRPLTNIFHQVLQEPPQVLHKHHINEYQVLKAQLLSLTMLLFRFLSTLQKVCGGVSPLLGMMMQMSVTARVFWLMFSEALR